MHPPVLFRPIRFSLLRLLAEPVDLRARSGLTTEQLIYSGRAAGWLSVPSLEPGESATAALQARLAGDAGELAAGPPFDW